MDPSGLDWVDILPNGDVVYQPESDGFWADYNVGAPFVIGKATGIGEFFRASEEYGGGLMDIQALRARIQGVYLGDHLADRGAMKHAIRGSIAEAFVSSDVGVYSPWTDRAEGALRVGYEPLGLVKNLGEGLGSVVSGNKGVDTDSIRTDGFFPDSMLFAYTAAQLDAGRGKWETGVDLIPEIVGRTNPVSAPFMAANDIRAGEQTGDYQRSGGGMGVLAMYGVAPSLAGVIHSARTSSTPSSPMLGPAHRGSIGDLTWLKANETIAADFRPRVTSAYSRPSGATTRAQRRSVQGLACATCGRVTPRQIADHIHPLVQEHYQVGTINLTRMRQLDAVQPQCPGCSNSQGGAMSAYSRMMRALFGVDQ